MKYKWMAASLLSLALLCPFSLEAAQNTLNLPGIGKMTVPQHVTFEKGKQEALPFVSGGGVKTYFVRKGLTEGEYYTLTYSNPPNYTYGWAMSQKLGIPFLQYIGEMKHKKDSPLEQMDLYADYLNQKLIAAGAVYSGSMPLVKVADKKNPRWEGSFVIPTKEKDISYKEAYQMVLQCDGYFTTLGIIATDADQKEVTAAVQKMVQKRKLPEKVKLLDLTKRGTSLTEY